MRHRKSETPVYRRRRACIPGCIASQKIVTRFRPRLYHSLQRPCTRRRLRVFFEIIAVRRSPRPDVPSRRKRSRRRSPIDDYYYYRIRFFARGPGFWFYVHWKITKCVLNNICLCVKTGRIIRWAMPVKTALKKKCEFDSKIFYKKFKKKYLKHKVHVR